MKQEHPTKKLQSQKTLTDQWNSLPPTPHQIEQLRQKAGLGERLGDRLNMLIMSATPYSQKRTNQKVEEKTVLTLEEL